MKVTEATFKSQALRRAHIPLESLRGKNVGCGALFSVWFWTWTNI